MTLGERFKQYPGLWFWLAEIALAVIADVWLIRHHKPTMSRTIGRGLRTPVGPVIAGAIQGLVWHLLEAEPFEFAREDEPVYPDKI